MTSIGAGTYALAQNADGQRILAEDQLCLLCLELGEVRQRSNESIRVLACSEDTKSVLFQAKFGKMYVVLVSLLVEGRLQGFKGEELLV